MKAIARQLAVAVALLASPLGISGVAAAPCAGFTDVDSQSGFCKNVEWLKNRDITTGCSTSTLYCPNDNVTRIQMSAFLNRLANALTTEVIAVYTAGGALDLETSPRVCSTVNKTVKFPHTAHGIAVVGAGQGAGDKDVAIVVVESIDSGVTWTPVTVIRPAVTVGLNTRRTTTVLVPPRALVVNTPYRWAIQISRVAGSATTGDVNGYHCQLQLLLENRITQSSPFDEDEEESAESAIR
jgi:hypothetical protein